jgi:hypothetical protein
MKTLILILTVLSTSIVSAYTPQDSDEILVVRQGKVIGNMSRKAYKVVKIEDDKAKKKVDQVIAKKATEAIKYKEPHNSIIIHGGVGQDGMRVTHENGMYSVEEKTRPVVGGTYCYTTNTVGVCGTGLSNKTGMISTR